jgi:hypothetical protein
LLADERVFASLAVVEESVRSVRTASEASRCDIVWDAFAFDTASEAGRCRWSWTFFERHCLWDDLG